MVDKKYTAFCGLYCKDCIPSDGKLFELLNDLNEHLLNLKFGKYAELKSKSIPIYRNYPQFQELLNEMKNLECKALCTQGGCKEDCQIRECVEEKGYCGCWECEEYKNCLLLEPLKKIHPIEHNLGMIREYGTEKWSEKRKKHYKWP